MVRVPCQANAVRSAVVALALALSSAPLWAQEVVFETVFGTGITPADLQEGQKLSEGTWITADPQTVVVLKRHWPYRDGSCEEWVILRGVRYRIEPTTLGECTQQGRGDELERAMSGESMRAHLTGPVQFIDHPKADAPGSYPKHLSQLFRDIARAKKDGNKPGGQDPPPQDAPARPGGAGGLTRQPATIPLTLFWHSNREDNATMAAPQSIRATEAGGYRRVRVEGCILAEPQPGTRPLILFWHPQRADNATVAAPESIRAQQATGGYRQVRVEGHVFERQRDGTVPLILFWNPQRADNATVAARESLRVVQQVRGGYRRVRIEGYVYPPGRCGR